MRKHGSAWVVFLGIMVLFAGVGIVYIPTGWNTVRADEKVVKGSEKDTNSSSLDVIMINKEGYARDRKGPVTFTHRKHALDYKILCWECHHEYVDGKNIWAPWESTDTCDTCHDPEEKQDNVMKLKTAFHINCKNCHKALAEEQKKSGPYRRCLQCHEKQ